MKRPAGQQALDRAHDLRRFSTDAEKLLWRHLRSRQLSGAKFRRQVWLGGYLADFVCLEARLVVEADGGQHAEQAERDEVRTAWLTRAGFHVVRYWNREVLGNIGGVLQAIVSELAARPSPSHRGRAMGPSLSPSGRGAATSPLPLGEREGPARPSRVGG